MPPVRRPLDWAGWIDTQALFFWGRVGRNVAPGRGDEQTIRGADELTSPTARRWLHTGDYRGA